MRIRLDHIEELLEERPYTVADAASFCPREACPCCAGPLLPLAEITGTKGGRVRVGGCDRCGYAGYQDIPTREWIADFYERTWDAAGAARPAAPTKPPKASTALKATLALPLTKTDALCEIGVGYGGALTLLKEAGFTRLAGVEHSAHRAATARERTGALIAEGGFESASVQEALAEEAPYRAIFSSHVLEHTYEPGEIIAAAAALQAAGDYLVIAVPHAFGEPSMSLLFFLPHLHSFTPEALAALLARHGYEPVTTEHSTEREAVIVAKKSAAPVALPQLAQGRHQALAAKLARELRLTELPQGTPMRFAWDKKEAGNTRVSPAARGPLAHLLALLKPKAPSTRSVIWERVSEDTDLPPTFVCGAHPILFYK